MIRFANLLPEVVDLFRRFPVPVVCCVLAFLLQLNDASDIFRRFEEPDALALTLAFFAGGAAHLFAESLKWSFVKSLILALVAAGAVAVLTFVPSVFQTSRLFLFLGTIMLVFVAPYLRRGVQQGAVWLFGLRLSLAALLALVVGLTLMLGLNAVVYGLKFLFAIDLGSAAWSYIGAISIYVVGPLFGLSMVPHDLDEVIDLADHKGGLLERGVSILVNYIKVPLAFVYALLLHAYAVKIVVQQSMPQGEVGWVVTLFAIAGTLAWLLAWPFRETGTRLLKLYSRFWFWFLPVPVVLLGLAVWQRVADYGMTPDRYGLILVALWAALVCGYLILRRSFADMRVIIGGAAALLLLGSFGPFGAVGTTVQSQFARFEKFLNVNGLVAEGKLKAVLPPLAQEQKSEGYSLLVVLLQSGAGADIQALLPDGEKLDLIETTYVSEAVMKRFGVESYWQDASLVSFNATVVPVSLPFAGEGRVAGPFQFGQWALNTDVGVGQAKFSKRNDELTLNWTGTDGAQPLQITFNQRAILQVIKDMKPAATGFGQLPVTYVVDQNYSLILTEGSGQLSESKAEIASLNFWVLQKK